MPQAPENYREFSSLVSIVTALRGPDGCPWDKEQTHKSLTRFAIEEAHELAEAIDRDDNQEICEELGDLLLQVVLHAEIARQEGRFDMADVIAGIGEKMVRRHPHVFADVKVKDSDELLDNWGKIKAKEKGNEDDFIRFNLPAGLPALIGAHKIGEKTKKWHFDWDRPEDVLAKVEEEIAELKEALATRNSAEIEHELGDLFFSLAQLSRHLNTESEQVLRTTNARFEKRFVQMQEFCRQDGKDFAQLDSEQMEEYWIRAKEHLKADEPD